MEALQEQPRTHLFLIKNKHAFRHFKNHDYFSNQLSDYASTAHPHSQFVQTPTPYGVDNAYHYICNEVSRNILPRHTNKTNPKLIRKSRLHSTPSCSQQKRALPCLLPSEVGEVGPTNSVLQHKSSCKKQEWVQLVWLSESNPPRSFQLRLNVYPYLLSTFLKSRINYREMSQREFTLLKPLILEIYSTPRQAVEHKDMVNLLSVREIIQQLENPARNAIYKRELVRYFLIGNPSAYQYQLNCLKDHLKELIGRQFHRDINHFDLHIHHSPTDLEVQDLHQLLALGNRFLVASDPRVIQLHKHHLAELSAIDQLNSRIKRWKSVAPEETTSKVTANRMEQKDYQRLFKSMQKKRNKMTRYKTQSGVKESLFINRADLHKDSDIFQ